MKKGGSATLQERESMYIQYSSKSNVSARNEKLSSKKTLPFCRSSL